MEVCGHKRVRFPLPRKTSGWWTRHKLKNNDDDDKKRTCVGGERENGMKTKKKRKKENQSAHLRSLKPLYIGDSIRFDRIAVDALRRTLTTNGAKKKEKKFSPDVGFHFFVCVFFSGSLCSVLLSPPFRRGRYGFDLIFHWIVPARSDPIPTVSFFHSTLIFNRSFP